MAYTIVKTDGTILTTIADGTINTTSTSLALPGRNYAGYGQPQDTNFVHQVENFAATTPPVNPLRGQLWYNTNANTLYVCPADGTSNALAWLALTSTSGTGATVFGAITATGNILGNNAAITNQLSAASGIFSTIAVSVSANIASANITTANLGSLTTQVITTGAASTAGLATGTWTVNGTLSGNSLVVTGGNIFASVGIKTDNYMYANGVSFSPTGTYTNANVAAYLPTYTGVLTPSSVTTSAIAGGGTISGIWTLTGGARLNATYADLAERFEADAEYSVGTVVELGGSAEVTSVVADLSETVFGVVSNTAAYLMNATAGNDKTHPPIALSGRVKVNVTGKVAKGDRLVSAGNGQARSAVTGEATAFNTIGRALADKIDEATGTVEAIVNIR